MDANTIITLVGSLGFPIVACIGLGWFISIIMKIHIEAASLLTIILIYRVS